MTEQEKIFVNRLEEIISKRKQEKDTSDLDLGITIGMQSALLMFERYFK